VYNNILIKKESSLCSNLHKSQIFFSNSSVLLFMLEIRMTGQSSNLTFLLITDMFLHLFLQNSLKYHIFPLGLPIHIGDF
jgi:hypothetical protein